MIEIFLLITFIALLSYLFCINKSLNCKCFTTHLVVGLTALVLYKLILHFKTADLVKPLENKLMMTKESFESLPDSINSFILGEDINRPSSSTFNSMPASAAQQYLSKLDSLVNAIDALKTDQQTTASGLQSTNNSTIDRLNLESLQQFQNFQIQYLQNQINKTKELINNQQIAELSKEYKPIKVYSSCSVSNAEGTLTNDQPIQVTNNNLNTISNPQSYNTMTQSSIPRSVDLSTSTGAFGQLLQSALNSPSINVNLLQ
jgi:hypothetical protein